MSLKQIELDYFGEPARLYCPVCGQAVYLEDLNPPFCRHVLFAAETLRGQVCWRDQESLEVYQDTMLRTFESTGRHLFYATVDDWLKTIGVDKQAHHAAEMLNNKSAFMITITTSDKGCGGMCNGSIFAIFDFAK